MNPSVLDDVVTHMKVERQLIEARLIEPVAVTQVAALVAALARPEFRRLNICLILDHRDSLVGIVIPRRILADIGLRVAGDASTVHARKAPRRSPNDRVARIGAFADE